jgi:hypothetical protein
MLVFEFELVCGHTDTLNSILLCPVKLLPYFGGYLFHLNNNGGLSVLYVYPWVSD